MRENTEEKYWLEMMDLTGLLLLLPFVLIRFGLMFLISRSALGRAAHIAPMQGMQKIAYWIYQPSNLALIVCLAFVNITYEQGQVLFWVGMVTFALGTTLLTLAVVYFALPTENGWKQAGVYRLSRNPMYVAYFVYFLGCVLLTQSPALLGILLVLQLSTHWVILAEERWCRSRYGKEYEAYQKKVRRYI